MNRQRVLQFEYQQYLLQDSDRPGWSEEVTVSVRLMSEALTSGWYRQRFGGRGNDFVILLAIVMHARPLRGPDLALLLRLGMARPEDEGRLYARVSNLALSDELGMDRGTVASATERLVKEHAIEMVEIPDEVAFRDSRGRFNGSKIYLLAGELHNRFLQKDIQPGDRVKKNSTVTDDLSSRAEKTSTVEGESEAHRAAFFDIRAENSRINIDDEESEEEVNVSVAGCASPADANATLARQALAYFAQRLGRANFQPSPKEQRAALELAQDSFSLAQIRAGIDLAFKRRKPPRRFTHCAVLVRDAVRAQAADQQAARPPAARNQPEPGQPETRTPAARSQPEPGQPETRGTESARLLPDDLARAAGIFAASGRELSDDARLRLLLMAEGCQRAAQAANASGGDWLAQALTLALGKAKPENLLGYADKVLSDWVLNGRSQPSRRQSEPEETLSPELAIFQQATGRLPLRDQRQLAARLIQQHGFSADYLRPFWQAWLGRDRKRSDLGWLDWAAHGQIPQGGVARPSGLEASAATLRQLEQFFAGADDGNPE